MSSAPRHRHASSGGLVFVLVLLLSACATAPAPPKPVEGEHALEIEIQNLVCCEGALRVALYHAADHWLSHGGMVRGQVAPVLGQTQIIEFYGLPPGDYALAVYQDLDGNARMNRFFGVVPREPYGFSNNPEGLGRPSFETAKVSVPAADIAVIKMRSPPF
jgi:uncharacterized protein (DUF2141 family)